jgi:hypothetical protein
MMHVDASSKQSLLVCCLYAGSILVKQLPPRMTIPRSFTLLASSPKETKGSSNNHHAELHAVFRFLGKCSMLEPRTCNANVNNMPNRHHY